MRTHYVRHADGLPVTEDEAMRDGVLRPGYRMSVGLVMSDAAMAATASGVDTSFIDHLPAHMLPQITRIIEDAKCNEVFRAQAAANAARRLADEIGRTQSAGSASASAARYVTGIADRAQARAVSLGGNPAHNTKDQAMTLDDSIQRLPHGLHSKIHYAMTDMRADTRLQVEGGITQASGMLFQLRQAQAGAPSPGLMGDAASLTDAAPAMAVVIDHLEAAIAKAQDRAANLNR